MSREDRKKYFTVILIRHGESTWNFQNKFTGWTDVPLTAKGKSEAIKAANLMIKEQIPITRVYTSILQRAKQTADIILTVMKKRVILRETWLLNERHYGALQGLNKKQTAKKHGLKMVMKWRRSYKEKPPLLDDELSKNTTPPCSGESLEDVYNRVIPYWKGEIRPKILDENILICAHGNTIRALLKYLFYINDKDIERIEVKTGKPIICYFDRFLNPIYYEEL